MIAASRRKILGLFAAAPFAGAAAAEELAGIGTMHKFGGGSMVASMLNEGPSAAPQPAMIDPIANLPREKKRMLLKAALRNPALREELESLAYEEQWCITRIDHDLASKRSFSLAAKVTFQRQRDVARSMETTCHDTPWMRIDDWSRNIFKKFLGLSL